jgi:hypothetical protein
MKYTASSNSDSGSYERPKPGIYRGVLIGVANLGTQTSQFGTKRRIALRWELHRKSGPSMDSMGHVHTIRGLYNQSFDVKASLRAVIEAHIGPIVEGAEYDSRNWLGTSARLSLKPSDDGKYVNVSCVTPLDPEEDDLPKQHEPAFHWEGPADGPPPAWIRDMVEKSEEWQRGEWSNGDALKQVTADGRSQEDDFNTVPF